MFLIIASQVEETACLLAQYFKISETRILTPADLSKPGWKVSNSQAIEDYFVAEGKAYPSSCLTGVLCLLPVVYEAELVQIEKKSRHYVAGEMTAFLRYWLSTLLCPVLNPPTPGCLSGPNWRQEQWFNIAIKNGIRTTCLHRSTIKKEDTTQQDEVVESIQVTLIGDEVLEDVDGYPLDATRKLAEKANLAMLSASYHIDSLNNYILQGVNTFPRLNGARAGYLVEQCFISRGAVT